MFLPARQLAKFPNSPERNDLRPQLSIFEQNTTTLCHLTTPKVINLRADACSSYSSNRRHHVFSIERSMLIPRAVVVTPF